MNCLGDSMKVVAALPHALALRALHFGDDFRYPLTKQGQFHQALIYMGGGYYVKIYRCRTLQFGDKFCAPSSHHGHHSIDW